MTKAVFFGPFIGEFGWELLFWQGWVRKVCKGEFKDYRKIAASFPGRQPFYPYVDEFWSLPESFLKLGVSGHGYYTDGWRGGYPTTQVEAYTVRSILGPLRRLQRPCRVLVDRGPMDSPDVKPQAEAMLAQFKQRLPEDTVYFVPWKWNRFKPGGIEFGLDIPEGMRPTSRAPVAKPIDFRYQFLEYLDPTPEGERAFRQIVPDDRELIAVFPRYRVIRRADKNWSKENYVELIQRVHSAWPDLQVAIFGEPGGAYFADGVPVQCLDLINVSPEHRMDIQFAALKSSVMALGSMSGAMLVALAAGCPALIWGNAEEEEIYHRQNFMGTPMIYYTDLDPSVNTAFELLQALRLMLQNWPGQVALRPARGWVPSGLPSGY